MGVLRYGLLSVVLVGCAAWQNQAATSHLQLGWEVAQQRAALAEVEVEQLGDRVVHLESLLREQGLDGSGDGTTVGELSAEFARLRGVAEELQFDVKGLRADFDQYQMDQERRTLHAESRLSQIERLLGVGAPPPPRLDDSRTQKAGEPTPSGGSEPLPVAIPSAPAPEDLPTDTTSRLLLAEKRMADGQQAAARAILDTAISQALSDDPQLSELQYRVGETWFNEGKFKEAARAFQVVTDKYPRSSWAPWAMLRIGECFGNLGRADAAQTFYQGVLRNHPGTDAAAEARSRLGQ